MNQIKSPNNYERAERAMRREDAGNTLALLAIVDAIDAQTKVLLHIADALDDIRSSYNASTWGAYPTSASEPEWMLFSEWIDSQGWPDNATHATLDKEGGCCWWAGEPAVANDREYGWDGELVERYYDATMLFRPAPGQAWYETLTPRPTTE